MNSRDIIAFGGARIPATTRRLRANVNVYCDAMERRSATPTERKRLSRKRKRAGEPVEQPKVPGRRQLTSAEAKPYLAELASAADPSEAAQSLFPRPMEVPTFPWTLPIQLDVAARFKRLAAKRRADGKNQTDLINDALREYCDREEAK